MTWRRTLAIAAAGGLAGLAAAVAAIETWLAIEVALAARRNGGTQ